VLVQAWRRVEFNRGFTASGYRRVNGSRLVRSGSLADIEAHLRRPALTLSADITEHDLHVRFVPKVISATFASVLHQWGQTLEGPLPEKYFRGLVPATHILRSDQ